MNKQNRVVLVTGGASGIGKEIAYAYAKNGFIVVIADINQSAMNLLQSTWVDENINVLFSRVDMKDEAQIINLFEQIKQKYNKVDILINNVGISRFKPLIELSVDEFDEVYYTNLRSYFITSREFAKLNDGNHYGRIINISSTRYLMSEPSSEAYAASKGGIVSLTHALAASLSGKNMTVNAISPGWIHNSSMNELTSEDHEQHLSKRVGHANDIVKACMYLTDEHNNFITGQNIIIDGGMTKKMIYV